MKKKTVVFVMICLLLMIIAALVTAVVTKTDDIGFFATLCTTFKRNAINVYAIVSVAMCVVDFLIILFTGRETPKVRSVWQGIGLFTLTFFYQCASDIFSTDREKVGIIAVIVVFSLFYIYTLVIEHKAPSKETLDEVDKITSEQALARYAKRKIVKCHQAITSIQLHKVVEMPENDQLCYNIDYIDSGRRNALNLNAVLNEQLIISKESYELFKPFLEAYEGYLTAESDLAQKPFVKTMEILSNDNISKLKSELNSHITAVSDITIKDCCASRLVLTYLSCLARVGKENADDYVGVRCESLNVCADREEKDDINKQLFSKFRTGFLGALLLKTRPYVFYYEQDQNDIKANRRYISFVLDHEDARNSYLVLVTANLQKDTENFHFSLLQAIRTIRQECTKIYEKYEVKQNGEN